MTPQLNEALVDRQKSKSVHIDLNDLPLIDAEPIQVKDFVTKKRKLKPFEIRSRIDIRNGRLNLKDNI